jgi:hypothetical protein
VETAISAEAAVSILPPAFTVTKVTLNLASAQVTIGGTSQFSAVVEGTNYPPQEVIWSVEGAHAGTGIDETGLLTVDIGEWAGRFVVRATSAGDAAVSGTAVVTVLIPPVVSGSATIGNRLYETLEEALDAAAGTEAVITIKKDLAVSSTIVLDRAGTRITLKGDDGPARTITGPGDLLFSLSGSSLTLDAGLTLYKGGVKVYSGSELVLKAGAKISGASGRGVTVNPYGTFTMSGGSVEGNAGGVNIQNHGAFTMSGGSVEGNRTGGSGGGVYVNIAGMFTMTGGSVKGNEVTADNGLGGGVFVYNQGTFIMTGGSIEGNRITGATGFGGGVYISPYVVFTMGGGSIDGNFAYHGGGLYVANQATFTMSGGSVDGNSAYHGGGVYVNSYGTFTLQAGSVKNHRDAYRGGGVFVYNSGSFTMSGGSVEGNSVSYDGGGVFLNDSGTFTMSGGLIRGNIASNNGGGVRLTASVTITKTGGTIYGSDASETSQKNVVTGSTTGGAAIYMSSSKRLENTVDTNHGLTTSEGWSE